MTAPQTDQPVRGVIWDFDGTLVETISKNMAVNRRIIETVTGRSWREWEILQSVEVYRRALGRVRNWRDLYMVEFGLSPDDTDRAGALWAPLQAEDHTPTTVYEGIPETLLRLHWMPHGIVSQNARTTIEARLREADLAHRFTSIIGYEEVGRDRQKPDPEGLLACIAALPDVDGGAVLFVGDHPTDIECAMAANRVLARDGRTTGVIAVAACFGTTCDTDGWAVQPAHVVRHPTDLIDIVQPASDA